MKPAIGPPQAISPRGWGAKVDYDKWTDRYTPDEALALHHGGSGDYPAHKPPYSPEKEMKQLRSWEAYHLSRGWRGIAYGWAIGQSGTIYRLRGWNGYGAHTGDHDGDGVSNNSEIIPILFIGSGDRQVLSDAAQTALRELRVWLEAALGRPLKLYGHQEIQDRGTRCPGQYGMEYVRENRWVSFPQVGDGNNATKKSMFIQVRTSNPTDLKESLEHIRHYHKDRSKDDYIYNVVLDEIGDRNGLHPNVDVIAPYLPGGTLKTFDNVFVGSHFVPWTGGGSHYRDGMLDSAHRWANLQSQYSLWDAFHTRFPGVYMHFYINHEGVLNWMDDPHLRAAYEAYLVQSVRDSHRIANDRAVLWAPALWTTEKLSASALFQLQTLFANVKNYAAKVGHDRGLSWLHFQDMMGRGWEVDPATVVQWYQQLRTVYDWDSLAVDMELFTKTASGLAPAPLSEVGPREDFYEAAGVPVGASWELRWWRPAHAEL